MDYIYYYLGYDDTEIEPDANQVRLRHELMKQIKKSKLKLKCCEVKHSGECVYLGTIQERLEAFKFGKKPTFAEVVKKTQTKRVRYVDACNPESNPHPMAHKM